MSDLFQFLFPVILIAGGAFTIVYLRPKMLNHVREMKFMTTSTLEEVQGVFDMMRADGLENTFRHYVEVKGIICCEQPVHTPFSGKEVAYCSSKLYSVTQNTEYEKDSNGNTRTRTVKKEDLLSDESSSDVLFLKDHSSNLKVALDIKRGCQFDIPETFDRFEPVRNLEDYRYFRSFQHDRPNLLGYRMKEKTIGLQQSLYVLGEAYKEGDCIHIGKPRDKAKSFIVSTKSEDELVGKYDKYAKIALLGGIGAIFAGILFFIGFFFT